MTSSNKRIDPQDYTVAVRRVVEDGETLFLGTSPEWPHVAVWKATYKAAYDYVMDAITVLMKAAEEEHRSLPKPAPADIEFSGKITLRLPKSLHREVAQVASLEAVSINQFLVATISRAVEGRTQQIYWRLIRQTASPLQSLRRLEVRTSKSSPMWISSLMTQLPPSIGTSGTKLLALPSNIQAISQ